ncbi:hypothetical protein GCM10023068_27010 [Leifsonia shinshuensis]
MFCSDSAYAGVAAEPEYGSTTFTKAKPTAAVKANPQMTARDRTCGRRERRNATPTGLAGVSGTSSAASCLPTITEP